MATSVRFAKTWPEGETYSTPRRDAGFDLRFSSLHCHALLTRATTEAVAPSHDRTYSSSVSHARSVLLQPAGAFADALEAAGTAALEAEAEADEPARGPADDEELAAATATCFGLSGELCQLCVAIAKTSLWLSSGYSRRSRCVSPPTNLVYAVCFFDCFSFFSMTSGRFSKRSALRCHAANFPLGSPKLQIHVSPLLLTTVPWVRPVCQVTLCSDFAHSSPHAIVKTLTSSPGWRGKLEGLGTPGIAGRLKPASNAATGGSREQPVEICLR